MNHVEVLVRAAGGRSALRKNMGVTRQAVYHWVRKGYLPPERATQAEALYQIPASFLVSPTTQALLLSLQRAR